ncbi:DUF2442 domain-containing protein [Pararhizobium sp.]|uniref:DUF2442 domain-containing protein n=1 Tax=Pararhizobium sp. TaxID=1977563 RepID=UPI00271DEB23|nr:DUF2442 domain-containing protein [Pararhizobium sp.]MDO9415788.1 DUF2442 domain-containing protein [Pararhizobium sp.]
MSSDAISVGNPLPRLLAAHFEQGRQVRIVWASGRERVVDLAPILESRRIYIALRSDDALFATLKVSEFGDSIEWQDGTDLSAVWLSKLPSVMFENADFVKAMDDLGMSLDGMALALDISRRLVAGYRKDKPIPRHIAFATRYLVDQREPVNDNLPEGQTLRSEA